MHFSRGIPVFINLKTRVIQRNEIKEFLMDSTGQVIKIGETVCISYKEKSKDEIEPISVRIKISLDGKIQLIRSGNIKTNLVFHHNKYMKARYQIENKIIFFQTYLKKLYFGFSENLTNGQIDVEYNLLTKKKKLGDYKLSLLFST